ncbi:DUF5937 family protein [Actinopolymorpha pittospori]|uniref:DNA-binding transcriptional ArsR family regulator n=1 Tax=Actinopolymorpha pittospori TaxID=648752 RepID=A0A927RGE9_9ACTN|nr:DNA-binding transcriptional ArsR family regulator [Actinopolymorpha pittospori]
MTSIDLNPDDISRIRFAISPVWETVTSVRSLTGNASASGGMHRAWARRVAPRLRQVDLALLSALIPPDGYIPDFLTPAPSRRTSTFDAGLAAVAATPPATVAADVELLRDGRRDPLLEKLIADPAATLAAVVDALDRYWRIAVEPDWSRLHALLEADLAFRMDELASGGVHQLFRSLHPSLGYANGTLTVAKSYCCHTPLTGQGLLLVPCVFAWPDLLVLTAPPHVPTVTYSPRGVGLMWEEPRDGGRGPSPLADLVGRTRAALVAQLDVPMSTTQLACQLDLTAPTLSAHLRILAAAGVVASRRKGRTVLYARTDLGERLLDGGAAAS